MNFKCHWLFRSPKNLMFSFNNKNLVNLLLSNFLQQNFAPFLIEIAFLRSKVFSTLKMRSNLIPFIFFMKIYFRFLFQMSNRAAKVLWTTNNISNFMFLRTKKNWDRLRYVWNMCFCDDVVKIFRSTI